MDGLGWPSRAMASSKRTVALMDSTKFGLSALLSVAPLEELDALIADDGLPRETIEAYEAAGVNLVVAPTGLTATA